MSKETQTAVGITGAGGRMGQALATAIAEHPALRLAVALDQPGAASVGRPVLPGHELAVSEDFAAGVADCDVLIDFTRPAGTLAALAHCREQRRPLVIGTTGFSEIEKAQIDAAAAELPILMAANFSLGVNLLRVLVAQAARALGADYDIEVVEAHHRHKVDAPSGTALALGEAAAGARGGDLEALAVRSRDGNIGARERGTIGFATVRGGDVVGDHQVLFLGDGERIEIGHRATTRLTFAHGALRAAAWLPGRANGLYDLFDLMGIAPPEVADAG